jgi:hypothetical protein
MVLLITQTFFDRLFVFCKNQLIILTIYNMKYFISILITATLFISGCGKKIMKNNVPTTTGQTSSFQNISTTTPSSTSPAPQKEISPEEVERIYKDSLKINTASWALFGIKELGFSIKLPFASPVKFVWNFYEGTNDEYPELGVKDMFWVRGFLTNKQGETYPVIGSISQYFAKGSEYQVVDIYDLERVDNEYRVVGSWRPNREPSYFIINPLKVFTVQGVEVVVFDAGKDFYQKNMDPYDAQFFPQIYAAAFKLPRNQKFKAAVITFKESDLPLDKFMKSLETMRFE